MSVALVFSELVNAFITATFGQFQGDLAAYEHPGEGYLTILFSLPRPHPGENFNRCIKRGSNCSSLQHFRSVLNSEIDFTFFTQCTMMGGGGGPGHYQLPNPRPPGPHRS